jgi:hypothetical protein
MRTILQWLDRGGRYVRQVVQYFTRTLTNLLSVIEAAHEMRYLTLRYGLANPEVKGRGPRPQEEPRSGMVDWGLDFAGEFQDL